MAAFRPCKVCEHRNCEREWLYVVMDDSTGLVKVGMTVDVSRRMAGYRAGGRLPVTLHFKTEAGCWTRGVALEERVLKRLRRAYPNPKGDWFDVPAEVAIAAVKQVCAAAYTEHRP